MSPSPPDRPDIDDALESDAVDGGGSDDGDFDLSSEVADAA